MTSINIPAVVVIMETTGFDVPGDGGHARYKRVGSNPSPKLGVQSGDGQWWELVPGESGIVARQAGAKGDDGTDDATALNNWLAAGSLSSALVLSQGIYLTGSTLTGTDNPSLLAGRGWQVANDNSISGTVIKASGTGVADLLIIQSTTPASQDTTNVEGVAVRDLAFFHRGSGDGLLIDNVIRAFVSNVHIDCNNEGAVGIHTKNWGFFATFEKVYIDRFITTGIKLGGLGTQHIIRDGHVQSTNATAVAAIETIRQDFRIEGGQYNVNHPSDDLGIGILVNNTDVTTGKSGGRIMHTLCEFDIAVKITGTSQPFRGVVVGYPRWNLSLIAKGIIFDRAEFCTLVDPAIKSPGGGGTLAEWTALSVDCGVICNGLAARSPLIVDASATKAWMRVTGLLSQSDRDLVTTDANLTVTVENVEFLDECIHNGVGWDKHIDTIVDDGFKAYTPPKAIGTVEIRTNANANEYIVARYKTNSTTALLSMVEGTASNMILDNTDGTLNGTTNADGKIHIKVDSSSGDLYIENRIGANRVFFVTFTD